MFMGLIPYNHSTQSLLHLLLGHLYNLSPIHTYVMHKSEKALGRSARKSCVACWERRLFLLKDGNVTAKWLGMTDTVEAGRRPEEQFKANFWKHLPAPAVCLFSTDKPPPMAEAIAPKHVHSSLSALCRAATLSVTEHGTSPAQAVPHWSTYCTQPRRDLVSWGLHDADKGWDQPHLHWTLAGFYLS